MIELRVRDVGSVGGGFAGGEGRTFKSDCDVIRIGRNEGCDLVIDRAHVSTEHARVDIENGVAFISDLRSTNGTVLVRDGARIDVQFDGGLDRSSRMMLLDGDLLELGSLGSGLALTQIDVVMKEAVGGVGAQIIAIRPIDQLPQVAAEAERDPQVLSLLYAVSKRIGAAEGLDSVIAAVAEGALELVPAATHVSIVLRDPSRKTYVPMLTRGRDRSDSAASTAVPLSRRVYQKVVAERAALLVHDAPAEMGASDSLLGAKIRSSAAVPFWKGEEIIGILQLDNRDAPSMLRQQDVDRLTVLAGSASLAVAAASLLQQLSALEQRLQRENAFLKGRDRGRRIEAKVILGSSAGIVALLEQIDKVADTRVSVLIEGETGVGKELVAAALHERSRRRERMFVTQNCAALPENLLESELFGHKRGAFTGATDEKKGLFEIADGGTLFLDEIGELPLSLQAKLLRAIQEGEVRPLGATQSRLVNVRIVAATHRNLDEEVERGAFREDLYYRLKVFPIRVPPLRERRGDIAKLATHFLAQYAHEFGKPVAGFSQQALEGLAAYGWPGNVRELQNEVQRLVIESEPGGIIAREHLSARIRQIEQIAERAGGLTGTLRERMDAVERYFVLEALREHRENRTQAARALGITREGFHKKLRALGIR